MEKLNIFLLIESISYILFKLIYATIRACMIYSREIKFSPDSPIFKWILNNLRNNI